MRTSIVATALGIVCAAASLPAVACDAATGNREQHIILNAPGQSPASWRVTDDSIHEVTLLNGFHLGVRVVPASADKYAELSKGGRYTPELVKISLFDMAPATPYRLTDTWGGANSIQGYGAKGGADRVAQLGDAGIELVLLKPVCAQGV